MAAAPTAHMAATAMATIAQNRRLAVFFGSGPRRAGTRFCARRNGDSFSASKSIRRASSSSSRAGSSGVEYNSSCTAELPVRANRPVVVGTAEQIHYNFIAAIIDREKLVRFAQGEDSVCLNADWQVVSRHEDPNLLSVRVREYCRVGTA